jgi:putative flippase GtrA
MIGEFVRFVGVSALGLVVDIALALILHDGLGWPLWLAATVSFFAIAGVNYLLFEFWLFAGKGGRFSARRALGVLAASSVAAAARIGAVVALESSALLSAAGSLADPLILVLAAGLSVTVNFVLNRFGVFSRRVEGK